MLKTPTDFIALVRPQRNPDTPELAFNATLNFVFRGDALLVREDDLALPDAAALAASGLSQAAFQPVGKLGARYCQTLTVPALMSPGSGYLFRKLRSLFGVLEDNLLAVAGRAFQLGEWARTHRFCGVCATPAAQVDNERCMKCPACGHTAYPRVSPAMMVLVKRGQQILLAKHAHSPAPFYTALAGFVEAGESVEEAVHREVMEEVGLRVTSLRYFASQPWPFPHSLMIAFTAEYAGGDIVTDPKEIAHARWFGPGDELPLTPHSISIASSLIQAHLPT